MVVGSTMKGARLEAFAREMESQGARTRKTKKGLLVYAPDGATLTIHTTNGDSRALVNDIAWFRRHGLVHPSDTKEKAVVKAAETNDEGYPLYMAGQINATTRKRVLAELESKGWPLRVRPTELNMDTVTAARALYNVGYRWDMSSPSKRRVWVAPDDIREMHERVQAEMKRREEEAREARIAAHKVVEIATIAAEQAIEDGTAEDLVIPNDPQQKPVVKGIIESFAQISSPLAPEPQKNDYALTPVAEPEPTPEREFIDSVDSWVVADTDLPPLMTVSDMRWALEAAGLEVEVRVWRKK